MGKGVAGTARWRTSIIVVAGLLVVSGLALGLYQSLFFRFASFYAFRPTLVGLIFADFYLAYFILAVPSALFHRRFGYKLGFLLGLSTFSIAAFLLYLAVVQHSGGFFTIAVAMMGASDALLDTSLNPMAVEAGNPSTSVARLNVVHVFSALGLCIGYFVAVVVFDEHFETTLGTATSDSARPYLLIGLAAILLAFYVEQVSLSSFAREDRSVTVRYALGALLRDKNFKLAAAAIFAVCAALMILWASHYRYHLNALPGRTAALFERGWIWFLAGKIVGSTLMRWIEPIRLLRWCVGLSAASIAIAIAAGGEIGWFALLSASAFFAIFYPTIMGYALDRHRNRIKLAAGLLVAAGGLGSALFAVSTNLALDVLNVDPRIVVCLALPFLAIVLAFARKATSAR